MLFRLLMVALAVAAIGSTTAATVQTATPPTEAQVRELVRKANTSKTCEDCVAALRVSREFARDNVTAAIELSKSMCPNITMRPADLCNGNIDKQMPVFIKSVLKADFDRGDDKFICHSILDRCPPPSVTAGTLRFPRPKPRVLTIPTHSGKLANIIHLSDWHVDELYEPGTEAECDRNTCCRTFPTTNTTAPPRRAASTWGDYHCDTPVKLTRDLMQFIKKEIPNIDFGILTGDIPPHDTWLRTKETVVPIEEHAYETIASFLGNGVNVYPAIGNHETSPSNLYPTEKSGGSLQWLYNSLSSQWRPWLAPRVRLQVRNNYGAYSTSPHHGFRIISLNTNFCLNENYYLYSDLTDMDPNHELRWLISELQYAEDHKERVWIIGHVAPHQTDCLENWSDLYHQIVLRYSPHVIAEQFFGHSHRDEFAIYYGGKEDGNEAGVKNARTAMATAWTGPSVTPYRNVNPGFRMYKVDTGSWNVFDSITYIANLDQAAQWDAMGTGPNWHIEYSAREAYSPYAPLPANASLSAAWWHKVTEAFEKDPGNTTGPFQEFWKRHSKQSTVFPTCLANTTCPQEMICALRSATNADACVVPASGPKKRRDVGNKEIVERGQETRPWSRKMCGEFWS
ncbi:MAG: Metallo-dependent phosphatase-like protein [Linnemannia gamsii]|nr:MAG: Metallo-dependent phosphatase-like protein [Linnemannia gamsii]